MRALSYITILLCIAFTLTISWSSPSLASNAYIPASALGDLTTNLSAEEYSNLNRQRKTRAIANIIRTYEEDDIFVSKSANYYAGRVDELIAHQPGLKKYPLGSKLKKILIREGEI